MKKILALVFLMGIFFSLPALSAEEAPDPEGDFTIKGTVAEVKTAENVLRVKLDAGFVLTFKVDEVTRILFGEQVRSLADLAPENTVEVAYRYAPDYEKLARVIRKL